LSHHAFVLTAAQARARDRARAGARPRFGGRAPALARPLRQKHAASKA